MTDTSGGIASHKFEHLSCFLPGLLALGADTLGEDALSPRDRERHLFAAQGIAHTCWTTYNDMGTGLGPDEMTMAKWNPDGDGKWVKHLEEWEKQGRLGKPPGVGEVQREAEWSERDYTAMRPTYLLRPEVCRLRMAYIVRRRTDPRTSQGHRELLHPVEDDWGRGVARGTFFCNNRTHLSSARSILLL